jgi:hypothetical protein
VTQVVFHGICVRKEPLDDELVLIVALWDIDLTNMINFEVIKFHHFGLSSWVTDKCGSVERDWVRAISI